MKSTFTMIVFLLSILFVLTLSAERECCPGDTWLNWGKKSREMYVYGFIVGYQRGHSDGCFQGTRGLPDRETLHLPFDPRDKCLDSHLDFSKGNELLAEAVTQYYHQYPADRVVTPDDILQQLAQGKNLAQVHQYPFMRPSH